MGASLWACSVGAREVFSRADSATGMALSKACFDGPADRLTDTAVAQPAVVATSLAAAESLRERLADVGLQAVPALCTGHSVGELAALAYSGAIDACDSLRLVATRGRLMGEASAAADGSMSAVLGLEEGLLAEVCSRASRETGATVQLANLNAPGQVVISGNRRALAHAAELARSAGAKRVLGLDVSGPFHSVYMQPAAEGFRRPVESTRVFAPSVPVVLNVTARVCRDPEEIRRELVVQVTSPVRWSDSVRTMLNEGCRVFVELGPGQVLGGLIKRISGDATVLNVEDEKSLSNTVGALRQLL